MECDFVHLPGMHILSISRVPYAVMGLACPADLAGRAANREASRLRGGKVVRAWGLFLRP